jgi:hypothetical protein
MITCVMSMMKYWNIMIPVSWAWWSIETPTRCREARGHQLRRRRTSWSTYKSTKQISQRRHFIGTWRSIYP